MVVKAEVVDFVGWLVVLDRVNWEILEQLVEIARGKLVLVKYILLALVALQNLLSVFVLAGRSLL